MVSDLALLFLLVVMFPLRGCIVLHHNHCSFTDGIITKTYIDTFHFFWSYFIKQGYSNSLLTNVVTSYQPMLSRWYWFGFPLLEKIMTMDQMDHWLPELHYKPFCYPLDSFKCYFPGSPVNPLTLHTNTTSNYSHRKKLMKLPQGT